MRAFPLHAVINAPHIEENAARLLLVLGANALLTVCGVILIYKLLKLRKILVPLASFLVAAAFNCAVLLVFGNPWELLG